MRNLVLQNDCSEKTSAIIRDTDRISRKSAVGRWAAISSRTSIGSRPNGSAPRIMLLPALRFKRWIFEICFVASPIPRITGRRSGFWRFLETSENCRLSMYTSSLDTGLFLHTSNSLPRSISSFAKCLVNSNQQQEWMR